MDFKITDLLNKGCQVSFNGVLYFCYNRVNSNLHFVKCGAKGEQLTPNKANIATYTIQQVISLLYKNTASIEIGDISN